MADYLIGREVGNARVVATGLSNGCSGINPYNGLWTEEETKMLQELNLIGLEKSNMRSRK